MQNVSDIQTNLAGSIEQYRGRKDAAAVQGVAKEMEALFAYEMIKVMRETSGKTAPGGLGSETFMTMFDQEISKLFAARGLGLRDMFEKGLKNAAEKKGVEPVPPIRKSNSHENVPLQKAEIQDLLPDTGNARVSSGYGLRIDPLSGDTAFHHGLDIAASSGSVIHPVREGTVVFSGEQRGYGNVVVVDHGDGFQTKYAHNAANLVHVGQQVDTESVIARVGSTGRSTGPHLHFEVMHNGISVAPDRLLALG